MKKTKIIIVVAVLAVLLLAVILFVMGNRGNQQTSSINGNGQLLNSKKETPKKQENKFSLIMDEEYSIVDNKLAIKIGAKGADANLGISAMAISFENLPAYLSNPKIQAADSSWKTNQSNLQGGKIKFVANNITSPIAKDTADFLTITFDANGSLAKGSQRAKVNIEFVDSGKKVESYVFDKEIKIISN